MKIYFVSNNEFKIKEAKEILSKDLIVEDIKMKIDEIQSEDAEKIVKDKVLKAFKAIKRPVFVEHTGLYIEDFGNLPGGLTQIVWDSLQADKFCDYFGTRKNTKAEAKTIIGYCDGKKTISFEGSISGNISNKPIGNRKFQWDCVFIPEGYTKTFAELDDTKNEISMRKIALKKFLVYLEKIKGE